MYVERSSLGLSPFSWFMAVRTVVNSFRLTFKAYFWLHVAMALYETCTFFSIRCLGISILLLLSIFLLRQKSFNFICPQKLPTTQKHNPKLDDQLPLRISEPNAANLMGKLTTEKCYKEITFSSYFKLSLSANCVALVCCLHLNQQEPKATLTGRSSLLIKFFSVAAVAHLTWEIRVDILMQCYTRVMLPTTKPLSQLQTANMHSINSTLPLIYLF